MKALRYHIIFSRILLICFIAGQLLVYAHQHPASVNEGKQYDRSTASSHQILKEKCYLCDVMHHNAMMVAYEVHLNPIPFVAHCYSVLDYKFSAARLIAAGGRAPPYINS